MLLRLLIHNLVWLGFMGLVLFGARGGVHWPAAWAFLVLTGSFSFAIGIWLLQYDPDLLRERMKPAFSKDQEAWDRPLILLFMLVFYGWFLLIALDAGRHHWSHMPPLLALPGFLAICLCFFLVWRTFKANSFAAPTVRLQTERRQHVVTTGPYAYVRHPMYAGALLFFVGLPLLLGSWYGLATAPLLMLLLAIRAVKEENMLSAKLAGYAGYKQRVCWRLIPHIW